MIRKAAYAGAESKSSVGATEDLIELAERPISRERTQRWTKRVGQECPGKRGPTSIKGFRFRITEA